MSLKELARRNGKNLTQVGIHPVHARQINGGKLHAGPQSLSRIAVAIGVSIDEVIAACDAAWNAKRAASAPDASAINPRANGAQIVHDTVDTAEKSA